MNTRQAVAIILLFFTLLFGPAACSASKEGIPTPIFSPPPPPTATIPFTPSPLPPTFTPAPPVCLSQPGVIEQRAISYVDPPQEFLVYLPPCYSEQTDARYPVLYLLHGQTYTQDQWVRLGAPQVADQLIRSGESVPFIMVFPDDRYWNARPGAGFGDRLILDILPYIDANYRTRAERGSRSLGGLSRGGGWTVRLGFAHPHLFGSLGLHSPAIFNSDAPEIESIVKRLPEDSRPRLWLDAGDADRELASILQFTQILARNNYVHEFHRYVGEHSELYWAAHVEEYLRWYTQAWMEETAGR